MGKINEEKFKPLSMQPSPPGKGNDLPEKSPVGFRFRLFSILRRVGNMLIPKSGGSFGVEYESNETKPNGTSKYKKFRLWKKS